jgi:hypothetical protein
MLEEDARRIFLTFLKPIINGAGNYYIEAQTRNHTRTDAIVDYSGHRSVTEMKIWRGAKYIEEGESQLAEYLSEFGLDEGCLLVFSNLRRKKLKKSPYEKFVNGKKIVTQIV